MTPASPSFQKYELSFENSAPSLSLVQATPQPLGPGQVRVAMRAASLNYRDLLVRKGMDPSALPRLAPLSDGAGEVVEVAPDVTVWQIGDRVMPSFFPDWHEGRFDPADNGGALGGSRDGVLAQQIVASAASLVAIPDHLSFAQAATLPCAAVTAWGALFERGRPLQRGDVLLVQGTGGVAMFGLQFARAVGARVIVLSSSDEKLARAGALGAEFGINYRNTPNWADAVRNLTYGHGADHILELGGAQTFEQSIAAVAGGGVISQIGVLTGFGAQPNLNGLFMASASINGIMVGPRAYLDRLSRFLAEHRITPLIDQEFDFAALDAAFAHLESGSHMGKVVVTL